MPLCIDNARIASECDGESINVHGAYVLPGLIDIHLHGNSSADICDASVEGLRKMAHFLAQNGTTSFLGATMALPERELASICRTAGEYAKTEHECEAKLLGINLEGPFLSSEKIGAQSKEYLLAPDFALLERLQAAGGGIIKIACVAPELSGAMDFIRQAADDYIVSIAHTAADYAAAREAMENGAKHITHLWNTMAGIGSRAPGVVVAAAERGAIIAELICDGAHLDDAIVRLSFMLFPGNIALISDAMRACGMGDGEYTLGKQLVRVQNGQARLSNGALAGSVATLHGCLKHAVHSAGIPLEAVIRAATFTPACAIGANNKVGSFGVGMCADILLLDDDLNIIGVYVDGQRVR